MKKFGLLLLCILFVICVPVLAFASQTDVYIGVTNISKTNVEFHVVDKVGVSIEGASIDVWANDTMGYQLLGVTDADGIFKAEMPYNYYKYRVNKVGYMEEKREFSIPSANNPHIERVVLLKEEPTPEPTIQPTANPTANPTTKPSSPQTGDSTNYLSWLMIAILTLSVIAFVVVLRKQYNRGTSK